MEQYPSPDMDKYAGVLDRRFEALLIDGLLVSIGVGVLGFVAGVAFVGGSLGALGGTLVALQFGTPLGLLAYQTAFEGYYGQTVGKHYRDIVVVKSDGSEITWGAAVVRNLLRIVDGLPVFYLVGIVTSVTSDDNQRLGDLAGDTVVVHT
ncbi:RDD family protein [Halorussus gelatinilyticus]|uniref:RDD family protein n=1 Tax=Halorussus gelatinilyticus TaxID=2937524 RepID=A0A8U0INT2_9EURY|nr:RDD family protein [Halorussus gelatinilyticus]UPW02251.1 RDD family protein [Halorussus gelatinilyticus]